MAVNWECAKCEAYLTVKEFGKGSPEWMAFADMRESLIWVLLVTGYPSKSGWQITEKNWEEIYLRIAAVERVAGAYRIYHPAEGETKSKKVYFTPEEIHSMIGFAVNAGNKSITEFKKWLYERAIRDAGYDLRAYKRERE